MRIFFFFKMVLDRFLDHQKKRSVAHQAETGGDVFFLQENMPRTFCFAVHRAIFVWTAGCVHCKHFRGLMHWFFLFDSTASLLASSRWLATCAAWRHRRRASIAARMFLFFCGWGCRRCCWAVLSRQSFWFPFWLQFQLWNQNRLDLFFLYCIAKTKKFFSFFYFWTTGTVLLVD